MASEIRNPQLWQDGRLKIDWVRHHMPLLNGLEEEFRQTLPFKGLKVALSVHLEAKTAYLCEVLAAGGALLGYRPAWGMMIGVRPSKVASELLDAGNSKTRVKKILNSDYLVIPKKAALATNIAITEKNIIGAPSPKDCSVYISIPFCPTRCTYCSFVSYTSKRLLSLIPEYLEKLKLGAGKLKLDVLGASHKSDIYV